jgi:hypothetical protein
MIRAKWTEGVAQTLEILLWKHKVQSSNPILTIPPKKLKAKMVEVMSQVTTIA